MIAVNALVYRRQQRRIVLVDADPERLRVAWNLGNDPQIRGVAGEPYCNRLYFHDRCNAAGGKIGDRVGDLGKRINLDRLDLTALLHGDGCVIIGSGRLDCDGGVFQASKIMNLRRLLAIYD